MSGTRTGANARSGPSIPEAARTARLVSIRLTPEDRELLDAAAARLGSRTRAVRAGLAALATLDAIAERLREGPVLLTLDGEDVALRLLRAPVPPCEVAAEGAGPGIHEALAGLRER